MICWMKVQIIQNSSCQASFWAARNGCPSQHFSDTTLLTVKSQYCDSWSSALLPVISFRTRSSSLDLLNHVLISFFFTLKYSVWGNVCVMPFKGVPWSCLGQNKDCNRTDLVLRKHIAWVGEKGLLFIDTKTLASVVLGRAGRNTELGFLTERSALITCTIHYRHHEPHVAIEHLKHGECDPWTESQI